MIVIARKITPSGPRTEIIPVQDRDAAHAKATALSVGDGHEAAVVTGNGRINLAAHLRDHARKRHEEKLARARAIIAEHDNVTLLRRPA